MPNHFHLLIGTGVKPLSELMRKLLTWWANSELGIPRRTIANYLNVLGAAITKSVNRGEKVAKEKNLKLQS